jgi:hypothetical protein
LPDRERFELRIARLDGGDVRTDPGALIEFFDLTDDLDVESALAKHFIPLACAAEGRAVAADVADMPWLAQYVLRVFKPGGRLPLASYRGWR